MNEPWIYLASASPRRRELLEQIGVGYRLLAIDVPEVPEPQEAPEVYVLRLALAKARAGREQVDTTDQRPVLGADTAVVINGEILGKPHDRDHAIRMLNALSGRSHQVMTAVAMVGDDGHEVSRLSVSHVRFRQIQEKELDAYWNSGEPKDKAGAYAIQGLGAVFIEHIEGSYSGVMGLPIFETAELLAAFTIDVM